MIMGMSADLSKIYILWENIGGKVGEEFIKQDLSIAYISRVEELCHKATNYLKNVYKYAVKGNTVAVILSRNKVASCIATGGIEEVEIVVNGAGSVRKAITK